MGLLGVGWVLLLTARCHLPRQASRPTPDSTSAVYVVRHGWHAGIAVRRADVPDETWPALDDLPDAAYLEVGWGEADYYPARDPGTGTLLQAGLWPTESVLHVVPVPTSVTATFPQHTIVRVPVGAAELEALVAFIAESFAEDASVVADGHYPGSRFYASGLSYHAANNCNHWAAAALEAAGCDTAPRWTFAVGQVVEQALACGTLVQRRPAR